MKQPSNPDWDHIEREVVKKLRILRMMHDDTSRKHPEVHRRLLADLYNPMLLCLANFCACIEEVEEEETHGTVQ